MASSDQGTPSLRRVRPHEKVIRWLEDQVRNGHLSVGDVVTIGLIQEGSKSPASAVRKALAVLDSYGILSRKRGFGIEILKPPSDAPSQATAKRVGLLLPSVAETTWFPHIHNTIINEAQRSGFEIVEFPYVDWKTGGFRRLPANACTWSAMIVLTDAKGNSPDAAALNHLAIPQITIGGSSSQSFCWDRIEAGRVAAAHLLLQLRRHAPSHNLWIRVLAPEDTLASRHVWEGANRELPCELQLPELPRILGNDKRPELSLRDAGALLASQVIEDLPNLQERGLPSFGLITIGREFSEAVVRTFAHEGRRIPEVCYLVAVDETGERPGSFLTTVSPDYDMVAREAWEQAQSRIAGTEPGTPVRSPAVILRKRRSTDDWIHKLWRGLYGAAVIKDHAGRLLHANPAFEELRDKVQNLRGKFPTDYWPGELGRKMAAADQLVNERNQPLLSVENMRSRIRYTFRFPFGVRGERYIGTLGFDVEDEQMLVLLPTSSTGASRFDPADEVIEAYFEALPCSVLVEQRPYRRTLYANATFRSLWPRYTREFIGSNRKDYQSTDSDFVKNWTQEEPEAKMERRCVGSRRYVPLQHLGAPTPPEGSNRRQRSVLYFFLFDSYFSKAAYASVGWDHGLLSQALRTKSGFVLLTPYGFPLQVSSGP